MRKTCSKGRGLFGGESCVWERVMDASAQQKSKLPEVSLRWSDFSQSLESLRHKSSLKSTTAREWFRINPLELLLLGCQTLITNSSAKREYGTMMLVMEPLTAEMSIRPRYWQRTMNVLITACSDDSISSFMLHRCISALAGLWKSFLSKFQPYLSVWCVGEVSLVTFLEGQMESKREGLGPQQLGEMTSVLNDIKNTMRRTEEIVPMWKSEAVGEEKCFYQDFFLAVESVGVGAYTVECVAQHLVMMKMVVSNPPHVLECNKSMMSLLGVLKEMSCDLSKSLSYLLAILHLLNVKRGEKSVAETSDDTVVSTTTTDDVTTDDVTTDDVTTDDLLNSLTTTLNTWRSLSVTLKSSDDIASQLLSLALVILSSSSSSLNDALITTTDFFTNTVSHLMIYSTEGYLSDSPSQFFLELIEYVSSLVEQGVPPLRVVQSHLPNLFGPVFGTKNHTVSCKLLEYGYLSACSRHQKSLLSEGLNFLIEVYHLFPPIDKLRVEYTVRLRKLETLEIVQSLIEDMITRATSNHDDDDETAVQESDPSVTSESEFIEGEKRYEILLNDDVTTDEERQSENSYRLQVLVQLLELACAMVRNGDNVSFLFASILPKLFSGSIPYPLKRAVHHSHLHMLVHQPSQGSTGISWLVDKKQFAIKLLELATHSLEKDIASPFQMCGVVAPKLVKNIDMLSLSEDDKIATTVEILHVTHEAIKNDQNVSELVSHGIDLITILLPHSTTANEARDYVVTTMKKLAKSLSHSSLLFMLKQSCTFLLTNFPDEDVLIQSLINTLIHRGKRDEIRVIFKVCRAEFKSEKYEVMRQCLYSFSSGKIKHRQFLKLCEILVMMMEIEKPTSVSRPPQSSEEDASSEEFADELKSVVSKLTGPCLERLEKGPYTDSVFEEVSEEISKIALFRTLFINEMSTLSSHSETELFQVFQSKFPPDVLKNKQMMHLLGICGTRMEHMQVPRFSSLKTMLSRIFQYFLSLNLQSDGIKEGPPSGADGETLLEMRMKLFDDYLLHSFSRNSSDRDKLTECGYSSKLWNERLSIEVKTDGSHSLEENMRQTLLACYREYTDILRQMAITHVSVNGELIKSDELFDDLLTLTDLKGRRAIVVKVIDGQLGKVKEGYYHEKKISLLTKEDKIEEEFARQGSAPVKPKSFKVAINMLFFDCAKCCGPQIVGCYAPNGEHCERPLEIGVRCDSGIISIYDETGIEIENAEILLTQEGVYLFKAYSNGHPYDTSQVWTSFFGAMLAEPSPLVPAIIVPKSYPNQRTWETLRRSIQPEMTGGILTCEHDFSSEWRTYYDHRPEKIRNGVDIVLHPGFTLSSGSNRPSLQRQKSRIAKDLAGMMFDHVMHDMIQDNWWKHFRFLGKWISQYLSEAVDKGELNSSIIEAGLDYERWKTTFSKIKNPPHPPFAYDEEDESNMILPSKTQLVAALREMIEGSLETWSDTIDIVSLCVNNHKQFLELKRLGERSKGYLSFLKPNQLNGIRDCLKRCTFTVPVLSLSDSLQEEIIHWIFRNEDRVWRYRGGRDGRETLNQFMNFLGRDDSSQKAVFAGVVTFCLPHTLESNVSDITDYFQVSNMVGYAVGEMVSSSGEETGESEDEDVVTSTRWKSQSCYEVVTAWTHPSYRGLNLAVKMYFDIANQVPARLVMCDMLEGSVERIINSNRILQVLKRLHIISLIVSSQQQSYAVMTPEGVTEQFEQVVFSVWPVRIAIKLSVIGSWMKMRQCAPLLSIPPLVMVGLVTFRRLNLF